MQTGHENSLSSFSSLKIPYPLFTTNKDLNAAHSLLRQYPNQLRPSRTSQYHGQVFFHVTFWTSRRQLKPKSIESEICLLLIDLYWTNTDIWNCFNTLFVAWYLLRKLSIWLTRLMVKVYSRALSISGSTPDLLSCDFNLRWSIKVSNKNDYGSNFSFFKKKWSSHSSVTPNCLLYSITLFFRLKIDVVQWTYNVTRLVLLMLLRRLLHTT